MSGASEQDLVVGSQSVAGSKPGGDPRSMAGSQSVGDPRSVASGPKKRVVAAMSGGVDSAVAAARAVDAGYDVVGVHLALSENSRSGLPGTKSRGCCTLSDERDARRSADILGIPFYTWDMAAEFADEVIDDFLAEYAAGHTPNPCMRCNEKIKFAAVLERAQALGFDGVVTGHYAQIQHGADGRRELHRAVDPAKDQSYVLGVLTEDQIAGSEFPLGDTTKDKVREEAAERGLLVARKPDSHDICFIPDGDTAGFLRKRLGDAVGPIVDAESGETLGEHDGAFAYTIGQRKGLDIRVPNADGTPRYVVDVDVASRTVMVGSPQLLFIDEIELGHLKWAGQPVASGFRCGIQVRAHGAEYPAVVAVVTDQGSLVIHTDDQIRAVAKGQTLVIYDGTRVVGSGTITATGRKG